MPTCPISEVRCLTEPVLFPAYKVSDLCCLDFLVRILIRSQASPCSPHTSAACFWAAVANLSSRKLEGFRGGMNVVWRILSMTTSVGQLVLMNMLLSIESIGHGPSVTWSRTGRTCFSRDMQFGKKNRGKCRVGG